MTHGRVFDDGAFAERYAERHQKMAERFRHEYAEKRDGFLRCDGREICVS
jgi:hypothetical protein